MYNFILYIFFIHFHSSLTSSSCCIKFQQRCTNTSKKALPLFFLFEVWANSLGNFKVTHIHVCVYTQTEPVFVMQMQLCFGSGSLGFLFALLQLADEPHHNEQQLPRPSHTHTSWWQRQEIVNNSKPRCLRVISPFALGVVAFAVARTSCCRSVISMPHTLLSLYVCVGVC